MFRCLNLLFISFSLFLMWAVGQAKPIKAIYFQRTTSGEVADYEQYWVDLLDLVLSKSGKPYLLSRYKGRALDHKSLVSSIEHNRPFVTICVMGTSKELEKRLLPIRIPIYRGLVGFRLFIVHKSLRETLQNVDTLDDLKRFSFGLGIGWSEISSYKAAGLQVVEAKYDNLFRLVADKRVDLFSRGIHEIYGELDVASRNYKDIVADESLLLIHPYSVFFFVSRKNHKLANAITEGFEKAYADGSFLTFFHSHPSIKRMLAQADLTNRKRFTIKNIGLSAETRDLPSKYWFSIDGNKLD